MPNTKKVPAPADTAYWRGMTDQKLEALATATNEMKLMLVRVEEKIDSVRLWRAKVTGISVAISAGVTVAVHFLAKVL